MTTSPARERRATAGALPGILLHAPRHYDFQVWFATGGRERWLREEILRHAHLTRGEAMLDVGCGTGTLAVAAAQKLGAASTICGIDAAPEMVAAARRKARGAGVEIDFREASAQALPFADATFDLVTSTLMLHHLPKAGREAGALEMARVLKAGGRVLAVDFASSSQAQGGLFAHLHRHGRVKLADIEGMLTGAGLLLVESGPLGFRDLNYVLAAKPGDATPL
jgi:ubiquinone/menaquinone biosynthesis C-methylase UbiE